MKDKILKELKAIANTIDSLDTNASYEVLQDKTKTLYEKLVVLSYISKSLENEPEVSVTIEEPSEETNTETTPTKVEEDLEATLLNTVEPVFAPKEAELSVVEEEVEQKINEEEVQAIVEEIEADMSALDDIFKAVDSSATVVKNDMEEVTPDIVDAFIPKTEVVEEKPKTLNDKLNTAITIGLNDKLGFIKHLFDGSSEDYNRVISQLNTIENEMAAKNFIDTMVKPDYNNWEGKEEYEQRLIQIIENKFI